MKRFEYQCIGCPEGGHPESWFSDLGSEGWELIGFDSKGAAWLKREIEHVRDGGPHQ